MTSQGGPGSASMSGGSSNDTIVGSSSSDSLHGGKGDDQLTGGAGNDLIDGDEGNDTAVFTQAFSSYTFDYDDETAEYIVTALSGSDGRDRVVDVEFFQFADGVKPVADLMTGLGGGTSGYDNLTGTSGNDVIEGLDGMDTLNGGAGNDTLFGGGWSDSLVGGTGNDSLSGGPGGDVLVGGAGNDTLSGGDGPDSAEFGGTAAINANLQTGVVTGEGTDTLISIEAVAGGTGNDTLVGDSAANGLYGNAGNDSLSAGAGNDTLGGGAGNDLLSGGEGVDTAQFMSAEHGVNANLATSIANGDGRDQLSSIENIEGSNGDDTLVGNAASNTLWGLYGDDNVKGGAGDDFLETWEGSDTLEGDAGDDTLYGEGGTDLAVFMGPFHDYAVFENSNGFLIVSDTTDSRDGTDMLWSVELFLFSDGPRTLASVLGDGPPGIGGSDASELLTGTSIPEVITALGGDDTLVGGAGSDTLMGGSGDDVLVGGAGDDVLAGGDGTADLVDYSASGSAVQVNLQSGFGGVAGESDAISGVEGVIGTGFDDFISGSDNSDYIEGGAGNDWLDGGAGSDTIDGGNGLDSYSFGGNLLGSSPVLEREGYAWTLSSTGGAHDLLMNVERVLGTDVAIALDLDANAGTVARIAGAALGAAGLDDAGLVGLGLSMLDGGASAQDLSDLAAEGVFGAIGNRDFVNVVYANITGSAPGESDSFTFTWYLDNGVFTRGQLLLMAANSDWCAQAIDLVGLGQTGLVYH